MEETMKAVRFYDKEDVRVENVAEPTDVGDTQVLVKPLTCGICGTDLHEYRDGPSLVPVSPHPVTGAAVPQILGHECSGVIEEVGPKVEGLRVGQRVVIMPAMASCGRCRQCREGMAPLCRTAACFGISAPWGGFAELALLPEENVIPIPDGMSHQAAALIEPTAAALYAVDSAPVRPGDLVLITGGGPIGQLVALAARAAGAVALISEPAEGRRRWAASLEVETHDPGAEPILDALAALGVEEADVCIECSGSQMALETCLASVRPNGTVVQTGIYSKAVTVDVNRFVFGNLTLLGRVGWPISSWPRVISLVASGQIPVGKVVSDTIQLEDLTEGGFGRLLDPACSSVKILAEV